MWRSLARIRLWRANPAIGYSIAVVAVLISIGLRFLIEPHVTAGLPFITFFPAIILTTFLGGLGPGIAVDLQLPILEVDEPVVGEAPAWA